MSAPDTNAKKQKRRHKVPLLGMAFVVLIGVGVIVYWIGEEVATAPPSPDEQPQNLQSDEVRDGDVDVSEEAQTQQTEN